MYKRRLNFILNWDTENIAYLKILDNDIYNLNNTQDAIYKINSIESIGWPDPFPMDNTKKRKRFGNVNKS